VSGTFPLLLIVILLAVACAIGGGFLYVLVNRARPPRPDLQTSDVSRSVSTEADSVVASPAEDAEREAARITTTARDAADRLATTAQQEADSAAALKLAAAEREAARIVAAATSNAESVGQRLATDQRSLVEEVDRLEGRRDLAIADLAAGRDESVRRTAEADRRDQRLDDREARMDVELSRLRARSDQLTALAEDLSQRQDALELADTQRLAELERVASLTAEQARVELVSQIQGQAKREAAVTVRDIERAARDDGESRARNIVTLAVQRVAAESTAESTVTVLHLPDDSMKGRIIGREGRNIRTFEAVTGVNVVIDDTPEAVLLSCFDPVRREIGRLTLEALVADGRIQPNRIEEIYERSKLEIENRCQRAGEDAVIELGMTDLHPVLVSTLGQLRYRTSYGQNVLGHLLECGHLAGVMAAELGLPIAHSVRCAALHDIGKALTHEVQGSHAIIGAELARRYGENDDVVHAIEAHHNEVEPRTLEAVLTQACDAVSGGRPGARRESLEHYVERLERLETIALKHEGVERVFAMQAGREVRIAVIPELIDDIGAQILARDIAAEIEAELTYPGQIRVTVVRESRATGLAR
jgi:ribonuclease Y